jgi:hypothetical protein
VKQLAVIAASVAVTVFGVSFLTETPEMDVEQERMQNAQIAALYACARNEAYAQGGWMEQPMLEQCIDDWFDANGKQRGVDY